MYSALITEWSKLDDTQEEDDDQTVCYVTSMHRSTNNIEAAARTICTWNLSSFDADAPPMEEGVATGLWNRLDRKSGGQVGA